MNGCNLSKVACSLELGRLQGRTCTSFDPQIYFTCTVTVFVV